jgi:hypothetical protein
MKKMKRNDKCHCGSLKKYKICCIDKKSNKYTEGQIEHSSSQIQHVIDTLKMHIPNSYNIIDITNDLSDEDSYRQYQLNNMNVDTIMVAEKTLKSEMVFFSRVDNNPNTNIIIMYQGSYRTFPYDKFLLMLNSITIFIKSKK